MRKAIHADTRYVAPLGVHLALETHNGYLHDLPSACRKLLDMTGHESIGINYDQGNIFINKNGTSIKEYFSVIGKKTYYVHLKNAMAPAGKSFYLITRLEEGHIDNAEILSNLINLDYKGLITLEYPCPGDGIIAAKRDKEYIDYLKKWFKIS